MIKYKLEKKFTKAIAYDDNVVIGECVYVDKDDYWNILHTAVDRSYQGKGIAKNLVNEVIANAKKNNKKVIADCSYAKRIIENKKNI